MGPVDAADLLRVRMNMDELLAGCRDFQECVALRRDLREPAAKKQDQV
jgi:hypothetical protein